jgi:hypothetical protein
MEAVACIEQPLVIKTILTHLRGQALFLEAAGLPGNRASPGWLAGE